MIDFSKYDAIVVGCGLTGGVVARHCAGVSVRRAEEY